MDSKTSSDIISRVRAEKQAFLGLGEAQPDTAGFADAIQDMASAQLKADAGRDVRNLALAALGVGVAGRGAVGLVNALKGDKPKKTRSGPTMLPLPYPVEPAVMPGNIKAGGFLSGDAASTKSGIPWYTPAMFLGGLGGLAAGWKGMDALLDARRKKERENELITARQQFHDALLSQYDKPLALKKAAEATTMEKVGALLDSLFDKFTGTLEKTSIDWSNLGGMATGGYGAYAGLSGLLAGALVYDKIQKRSQRAVLEKAMQRRQRREFMQRPTEIYAIPEPVSAVPKANFKDEMKLLTESPEAEV